MNKLKHPPRLLVIAALWVICPRGLPASTLTVTTTSPLAAGVVGQSYAQTLAASGGTSPYSWSIADGTLPAGLTLSTAGVLSGTPTAAATSSVTVQATDGAGATARAALSLTIDLVAAANGIGIPSPVDPTTYAATDPTTGTGVAVPAGMVYVPAGSFTYGTGTTAAAVSLDGFCINRFEVTNAEFKAFLDAAGSTKYPSYWSGGTYPAGKANHPVLFVSLTQAQAYAAWISQQTGWNVVVPSAYQWEKAARGPNSYLYPWGNALGAAYSGGVLTAKANFNANVTSYYLTTYPSLAATYSNAKSTHYNQTVTVSTIAAYDTSDNATLLSVSSSANVSGYVNHDTYTGFIYTSVFDAVNAAGGYTTPVGSYETGKSAYGTYDQAGNAYEWTTTTFTASNGAEAGQTVNEVRGGSWYSTGASCQSVDTGEGRSASGYYNTVGFRVAMIPAAAHPAFFAGEASLGNDVYHLTFADGVPFGYYSYAYFPYLYHFDAGFLYFVDAKDSAGSAYLYDFASQSWWYTAPAGWPYLYDFRLGAWLYYFPNASDPTHYTAAPRYFYNFSTRQIFSE